MFAHLLGQMMKAPADGFWMELLNYTTAEAASSYDVVLNKPSGTAEGDLLIAVVAIEVSTTFTPPTGWTSIRQLGTPAVAIQVFYKVATASEASSYTFHAGREANNAGILLRFGVTTTPELGLSSANSGRGSVALGSIIVEDETFLTICAACPTHTATFTPPSGMETLVTFAGSYLLLGVFYKTMDAGSTGTLTLTCSDSANDTVAAIFAFSPLE